MPGKHFDLDIDINLGGENASDNYISSQKATKTYIDQKVKDIKVDDASWGKITGTLENQKDLKTALDAKANTSDLAKVATTGAYTDITGIPTNVSEFTNDAGYLTEHQDISGKADKKDTYTKTQVDGLIPDVSTYNAHIANTDIHVTSEQKTAWTNKQDEITDLTTIRNGAKKGATSLQEKDNISKLTNDAGYLTSGDIASAMMYKGSVDKYTDLPTTNKTGDVYNVKENGANYAWDGTSWDYLGETLDLSAYQTKITTTNKLSTDLLEEGTTNKLVSATEKTTWNNKQNSITDLETIRTNAKSGKDASTTIATYGNIVTHNVDEFAASTHEHTISQINNLQNILDNKQANITEDAKLDADLLLEGKVNKLVSANEKTTWSNKQDAITDLATIRANSTAGKTASDTIATYGNIVSHNATDFAEASHTHTKADITDLTIPRVNDATITIQKNGTKIDSFTANQSTDKIINIAIPTEAADVSALADTTKYAADLALSIDPDTFIITALLKDQDGTTLATQTIDLPLETVVVSGSYDNTKKQIVLSLQNGTSVEIPVADLVDGLQTEITTTNKLSADLIQDGTTNKIVTLTEKNTWNAKQDAITDLATIRSGAAKGATAVQAADLGKTATTNSYIDLDNLPTIPTITDTYSATGTDGVSGKAVASAIQGLTKTVITFRAW